MSPSNQPVVPLTPPDMTTLAPLPMHMRLLCFCDREPSWVTLTLKLDAAGCLEPQFRWTSSASDALAILSNETFDCILLFACATDREFHADVLKLVRAIRTGGCDDAMLLVTSTLDEQHWVQACEQDCDVLISSDLWESPAIIQMIRRALTRVETARENHRLSMANQRRLLREREEAANLLHQQRQMIEDLVSDGGPIDGDGAADEDACVETIAIPQQITDYYHELLRTYVIMGSGSLGREIGELAELLALAGISPRETLDLHLERVESLVHGLGSRSTRHVMARADLLALELMIHLGECYQNRMRGQASPGDTQVLPTPDPPPPTESDGSSQTDDSTQSQ